MGKKIRLLALDLDGTLLNGAKQITPRTQAALERARQQGVLMVPVTGRPAQGLPPAVLSLPGLRYAVTSNGATIRDLVEQQVLPVKEESYADLLGLKAKEEDVFKSFRERDDSAIPGDIDFEPSTESVMSYMMNAYLNNAFYYAMLDSAAGEQGARRNAMKSATDNANEMVSTLERVYNTVRQGAITTEITEIVGGAAALED